MDALSLKHAVNLLSQQIWCWGCDITRPDGNWLIENGFHRVAPPDDHEDCSSVYALEPTRGRCVVLRGFGIFYGDHQYGGIFVPRYEFQPRYTPHAKLESPPWFVDDLPSMVVPAESERKACTALMIDLIRWIEGYEVNVINVLGVAYRQQTLTKWDDGKRHIIPAGEMAHAWQRLGTLIAQMSAEELRHAI